MEVISNIIEFHKTIEDAIYEDDVLSFKFLFERNKSKVMSLLMLAIEYESINIVKFLFFTSKNNIDNLYNNYPLIYYSYNKEINKFLNWTNDKYSFIDNFDRIIGEIGEIKEIKEIKKKNDSYNIFDENVQNELYELYTLEKELDILFNEIIKNNMIGIAKIIIETYFKTFYTEISNFIFKIIENNKHIMFEQIWDNKFDYDMNAKIWDKLNYNNHDLYLMKIYLENIDIDDIDDMDIYISEAIEPKINILYNSKNKQLNNTISVYKIHDKHLPIIITKMKYKDYLKQLIKLQLEFFKNICYDINMIMIIKIYSFDKQFGLELFEIYTLEELKMFCRDNAIEGFSNLDKLSLINLLIVNVNVNEM